MKESKIAYRYALALFTLSQEQNILEEISGDMVLLAKVIRQNDDLERVLKSPVIRADKKLAVLKALFENDFHKTAFSFLRIIVMKGREELLIPVTFEYEKLYKELKGIQSATLTTAAPVKGPLKEEIISVLEKETGKTIELETAVDEELIGGFLLSVEDKQFDASFRKKLKKLTREFNVNIYEKGF